MSDIENTNNENSNNKLELDQIDGNLWNWLKNYELTNEYISTPKAIEEKADWVTDTYKNYEERNYKYQLEICNLILDKVPQENIIIEYKKKYELKLIELRKQFPLPDKNIDTLISDINNAFYRLEKFMKGEILEYKSYLFNDAFTLLFNELNKFENVNIKYDNIKSTYWYLMSQIAYAHDKGEFKNQNAYQNEDFNRDCNEIIYLQWDRMEEFNGKFEIEDYQFEVPSIIDVFNNPDEDIKFNNNKSDSKHNHIFKNNAFEVWQYMFDEFDINKSSRTDVKFMFEEMKKESEGLIHNTVSQITFLDWIRKTYNGLIIEKTSNYSRTLNRLQTYSRAKELYKE